MHNIPDIIQDEQALSGAAIASTLKNMNDDSIVSQKDIREMVDAARDLSGYEPFQTWRINLRRVLTSQALRKQELPEFQSNE